MAATSGSSSTSSTTTSSTSTTNASKSTGLSNLSAYQNYVIGHNITQTADGFTLDSTYYKKYYSMISVELYFGDTYIEDAHDITWQVVQQQQPLFGYNSYIFDELALGSRLVQGTFTINFTGAGVVDRLINAAQHTTVLASSYTVTKSTTENTTTEHKNSGVVSTEDEKSAIWTPLFDLDIVCMGDTAGGQPAHMIIEDANVSRCSTQVSAQGGVLMQQYSFIGRNIRNVD